MREVEVPVSGDVSANDVKLGVERACDELGLQVGLRDTLASYPGSVHWHMKREGERGTLEITFAPVAARLWLSVHAGRDADWIDDVLMTLPKRIVECLGSVQSTTPADLNNR